MTGDPTSEPGPAPASLPDEPREGRAAYAISQLYYYVAAVIGVGFLIGGAIALLLAVRTLILPGEFDDPDEAVRGIVVGVSFALPGLAAMWWHLRQARRREGRVVTGAFWGSALYFHLVALVALIVVLSASTGLLLALGDLVYPECGPAPPAPVERGIAAEGGPTPHEVCFPQAGEALRNALDAVIFLAVAAPVMWWHLRQGRRLTTPPQQT